MTASLRTPAPETPLRQNELSLAEMLRVMDVARAIRQGRETVEDVLNHEETRRGLRERLLASAQVSGDTVTAEEVDAAIAQYFASLHAYADPPWSWSVAAAYVYIWRVPLLVVAGLGGLTCVLVWWLFYSSAGMFNPAARAGRNWEAALDRWNGRLASVTALANDPAARDRIGQIEREADAAAANHDAVALDGARGRLESLESRLTEAYVVSIVTGDGRKSGIDRYYEDESGKRVSGYYVIVEARDTSGRVLPRSIRNRETGMTETVTSWGEQVHKEVYDRVGADKRADGVVDDAVFAVKERGRLDEQVRLTGTDGRPLSRQGQITRW